MAVAMDRSAETPDNIVAEVGADFPIRRLRVAAMHGILRPVITLTQTDIDRAKILRSFSDAVDTAIAEVNTLKIRGMSLLDQRFPPLCLKSVIHEQDFEGSTNELLKKFLQRMEEFNIKGYNDNVVEKYIRLALTKLNSPIVTIGVLGRIKCGKSTLLNAITHSDLFPTDACNPETSVIVSIRHSNSIHVGPCDENNPDHGALKCPQLQNSMGVILACGSRNIQRKLSEVNIEARKKKENEQYYIIVVNLPALGQLKSIPDIVLQDTPGLGEATSQYRSTHITDLAETALLTCSAYIYILDCSKLRDQLDVAALELLKVKDHEVYQDGRLLTIANQLDRTIQHQPVGRQKKVTSIQQTHANVKDMLENDIRVEIPDCLIIPSIAYWAWFNRVSIESEDLHELNSWRRRYERAFGITSDKSLSSKQFIEDASGMKQIENWLRVVSMFSDDLLKKSKLSDAVYCSMLCINACDSYKKALDIKIEDLVLELEAKKTTWNEAIKLIHAIEMQLELFRSVLEAAYESDIEDPKRIMLQLANEMLVMFQDQCCQKCRPLSVIGETEQDGHISPVLPWDESDEDDTEEEETESDDDIWWDRVRSPISPPPHRPRSTTYEQEHNELPAKTSSVKHYRVKDFKRDLECFIHELENRINDYLANVRFVYIPRAIPLEEFGENKKQLYQFAINFLQSQRGRRDEDQGEVTIYEPPRPQEIQDILTNRDVSLVQLREKSQIKMLKLGWLGRMRVWYRDNFTRTMNAKETHIMRKNDVVSAIKYIRERQCLKECNTYLEVHMKEEIVECYYSTFSQHVRHFLNEYEKNCMTLMTEMSTKKEEEMHLVLKQFKRSNEELNYLINSNFILQQLKDDVCLDLIKTLKDNEDRDFDFSVHKV